MTTSAILLETPEGVKFSLPLAGIVSRFLAWIIDGLVITTISTVVGKVVSFLAIISFDWAIALSILLYFIISVGYGIALEWLWHGQTIGKRVLSLRVLDANGLKLQLPQIAIRNLMRTFDSIPFLYLTGGIAALINKRRQRFGDMVANTIVVEQRRLVIPDLLQLNLDDKFNSLLSLPHLAARLRQQITPELVEISYQALLRRDGLNPNIKLEVFRLLAGRFRELVKFPEEISSALTDERYVRNALQIALSSGRLRGTVPQGR